jgi:hypothetical protein
MKLYPFSVGVPPWRDHGHRGWSLLRRSSLAAKAGSHSHKKELACGLYGSLPTRLFYEKKLIIYLDIPIDLN